MKPRQVDNSLNDWQVAEIEKALGEAGRGEFATDEEVNLVLTRWSRTAAGKPKP
jgi:predicted transcriptional regulator